MKAMKEEEGAEKATKEPIATVREKIKKLNKEDRDKLKKKLKTKVGRMREKLDKGGEDKKGKKREIKDLKAKMDDLEQMLLLKEDDKDKKGK